MLRNIMDKIQMKGKEKSDRVGRLAMAGEDSYYVNKEFEASF